MHNEQIKHGQKLSITVEPHIEIQRIDQFLHNHFPLYSRSFFQRAIDDGYVQIDGKVITKSGHMIKPGSFIEITFPEKRSVTQEMIKQADLPIEIVYEHPQFLIINKPAGLLVHPTTSTSKELTLADWIVHSVDKMKDVGSVDRPGIIHRLDKLTSGLMIIPRTNYAYGIFGDMFRNREIDKTYYALVKGHPPKKGTIDLFIGRHPIERNRMTTYSSAEKNQSVPKMRHAITHYEVTQYYQDEALVKVTLETGRTHQIRVHFAAIGHPIVGDVLYGQASPHMKRQALHAQALSFTFDNQPFSLETKLPDDMLHYIATLKPISE